MRRVNALRVLYVEDDQHAAASVMACVADAGDRIVWEATVEAGLKRATSEPFDVIIADRMLPDGDGIGLVAALRAAAIATPVLMLSALSRTANRVEGLDAGADDYLAKPFEPSELVARIRALHRRMSGSAHGQVLLHGSFQCHLKARTAFRGDLHLPLSPKEWEMFRYFMENAGNVVTRDMLLQKIWNMSFDPQTNVVDVNIGRLRRKLEEGTDYPALETIWGSGYRLLPGR